jgi:hypothetical protein
MRHGPTAGVFHLSHCAPEQAFTAQVFHPNHHSIAQVHAARVFRLHRRDRAPRVFHLNHLAIDQARALGHSMSELKSGLRDLQDNGCSIVHTLL